MKIPAILIRFSGCDRSAVAFLCLFFLIAKSILSNGDCSGEDNAEVLRAFSAYYAGIEAIEFDSTEVSLRYRDASKVDSEPVILSEVSNKVRWERDGRYNSRSLSRSGGVDYSREVNFDGKRFLAYSFDPEGGIALASSLKPSWALPSQSWNISGSPIGVLTGFHCRDFLPKNNGLVPLSSFVKSGGLLQMEKNSSLKWVGDSHRILVTSLPDEGYAVNEIRFELLKIPDKTQPRTVSLFAARFSDFVSVHGVSIPLSVHIERELCEGIEFNGETSPASRTVTDVRLSELQLNRQYSNSDFMFQSTIPNYTNVRMVDAEQLKFHWLDGEIVPTKDEEALRLANEALSKKAHGIARKGFHIWPFALILLVIGVGIYFRFKSR